MIQILFIIIIIIIIFKMKNKKESEYFNNNPNQQFELMQMKINTNFKHSSWLAIASFLIFLLVVIALCYIFIVVGTAKNPAAGWLLVLGIWCIPPAIIPMTILNIISHIKLNRYNQNNISGPTKTKKLIIFNYFQIPIMIIVIVLGFILMVNLSDRTDLVIKEIEKRYGNEYTILYQDHISNEAGTNEYEMLIKVEEIDIPLYVNYDIIDDIYNDNYDNILRAKKLNYNSRINKIFKEDVFSYMEVYDNYEGYECATLVLIVEDDSFINKEKFISKIEKIIDIYGNDYKNFYLRIFSTTKLRTDLEYDYKTLAVTEINGFWIEDDEYSHLYESYTSFYTENYGEYDYEELCESISKLK